MEAEEDLYSFLASRNISQTTINQLTDDKVNDLLINIFNVSKMLANDIKGYNVSCINMYNLRFVKLSTYFLYFQIDINVINVMTDEELGKYIASYGDRLALRAFCRQKTVTIERTDQIKTVKTALMQKLRDRLRGKQNTPDARPDKADQCVGNRHAAKDTRRVEMGWLHFDDGDYHQVRTRHGGGTRHLSVQKTITMEELLETGKDLFFPNGRSVKGPVEDFNFDMRLFSHNSVPLGSTVNQLYEETNLRMLRIYTCSRKKEEVSPQDNSIVLSDTSSDFEPTENRPVKVI